MIYRFGCDNVVEKTQEQNIESNLRTLLCSLSFILVMYPIIRGQTDFDPSPDLTYAIAGVLALLCITALMLLIRNELFRSLFLIGEGLISSIWIIAIWLFIGIACSLLWPNAEIIASRDGGISNNSLAFFSFMVGIIVLSLMIERLIRFFFSAETVSTIEDIEYGALSWCPDVEAAITQQPSTTIINDLKERIFMMFEHECQKEIPKQFSPSATGQNKRFIHLHQNVEKLYQKQLDEVFTQLVSLSNWPVKVKSDYEVFITAKGGMRIIRSVLIDNLLSTLTQLVEVGRVPFQNIYSLIVLIELHCHNANKRRGKELTEKDILNSNFLRNSPFLKYHFSQPDESKVSSEPSHIRMILSSSVLLSYYDYILNAYDDKIAERFDVSILSEIISEIHPAGLDLPKIKHEDYFNNRGQTELKLEGKSAENAQDLAQFIQKFVRDYLMNLEREGDIFPELLDNARGNYEEIIETIKSRIRELTI